MAGNYRAEGGKVIGQGVWTDGRFIEGQGGRTVFTIAQAEELHGNMGREPGARSDPLGEAIKQAKSQRLMQRLKFWQRG